MFSHFKNSGSNTVGEYQIGNRVKRNVEVVVLLCLPGESDSLPSVSVIDLVFFGFL